MSARKFGKSWWVDFHADGMRRRLKSPENSQKGARAYELLLKGRLARGESIQPKESPSFSEFAAEWLQKYVRVNNKVSEQTSKEIILRKHLVPHFEKTKLPDIGSKAIDNYKAEKKAEGLCEKTINNHLMVLSKCLNSAVEWDVLDQVPMMRPYRVLPAHVSFLSQAEIRTLLSVMEEPWKTMVITALFTGLRLGELLGLKWADINFDQRVLIVQHAFVRSEITTPKSGKARMLPLSPIVLEALQRLERVSPYVFQPTAHPTWTAKVALCRLQGACKRAGIRKFGWHMLRHSFASHLVSGGAPIRAVQQLLGHSTVMMTERYAHLAPAFMHETMSILGAQITLPSSLRQPAGNALEVAITS